MAIVDESQGGDPIGASATVRYHHHDLSAAAAFQIRPERISGDESGGGEEGFNKEMRDLEELLSKLNPMAEEFVPPSIATGGFYAGGSYLFGLQSNCTEIGGFGRRAIHQQNIQPDFLVAMEFGGILIVFLWYDTLILQTYQGSC